MLIVKSTEACPLLRAREWVKRGRIWTALRPLLGNGLLTSEGAEHTRQRQWIGNALRRIERDDIADAVESFTWPAPGQVVDVTDMMLRLSEHVMRAVLFGADASASIGPAIRGWLRLFPLRLLGLPVGRGYLRTLDREIAALPRPAWMPEDLSPQEVRDQLATLYVAAVETTAAALTWQAGGVVRSTPIWFLPRQHAETGENALVMLSPDCRFGAGHRKCIGDELARDVLAAVRDHMALWQTWEPVRLDMRPRWGLTRWPKRVIMKRCK